MLDLAREIITTQPILATFLAIGLGYLVGQINIFGFSLGVGAVLRSIRAKGFDHRPDRPCRPDHVPVRHWHSVRPAVLRGYDVAGIKYNLLALIAVLAGLVVALVLGQAFGDRAI